MSCIRLKRSITELFAIAIVFLNLGTTTASAADLVVVDGELIGATDVTVFTFGLFDVRFVDGSYNSLVNANQLNIQFTVDHEAQAASVALLDQVFIFDNVTSLNFDTNPNLTLGVQDDPGRIITPFSLPNPATVVPTIVAVNDTTSSKFIPFELLPKASDTSDITSAFGRNYTYASWTPAASLSAVPEPSTYAMMALGLLGIAGMLRRKSQA